MVFYAKKYNSIEGYDFKIHVYIHSHFHKHCYFKIYIPLLFPLKRCGQNKLQGKSLKGKYNSSCKSSQSLCSCSYHSSIKFISSRHRVISSIHANILCFHICPNMKWHTLRKHFDHEID